MSQPVLDQTVIDSLRQLTPPGEPDVLGQVLQLFLEEVPPRLAKVKAAWQQGNATDLQRAAHSLKGSSGNIGALALYDVCKQLDDAARTGDLTAAEPLLAALDDEYARVEAEIRRLLQTA